MTLSQKVASTIQILQQIEKEYLPAKLASSFGAEDQVLTDLIVKHAPQIAIITLDTGRLHQQTYDVLKKTRDRYQTTITVFTPRHEQLESHMTEFGPNAFYESIELRKACCFVRKVEPLKRAIGGSKAWLTGLRREQAVTRHDLGVSEWDAAFGMQKFNPLLEWGLDDVWNYIKENDVPYNVLHDQGFPSIGCEPCTRAVAEGEDIRAGRWWWEDPVHKECGLHNQKGKQ
ncbi:MAG: phosphoadenylyl-sulfate reductase [Magnetococcales bacterium]|nr:phosphoadenylyl-sulfate reductase [Magnetococcales bacterium]